MLARHAVLLTPSVLLRLSQLPCYSQNEHCNFHSSYILPSSVSSKSFACHSLVPSAAEGYKNCRVCTQNSHFGLRGAVFAKGSPKGTSAERTSSPYLITSLLPYFLFRSSCDERLVTPVNPLDATPTKSSASVANKRLTAWLSPLDATLTKNRGYHPSSQKPSSAPSSVSYILTSLLPYFIPSRNGCALPAAMGAAAKRARRLQERRS